LIYFAPVLSRAVDVVNTFKAVAAEELNKNALDETERTVRLKTGAD
jgi:hypothetical protein